MLAHENGELVGLSGLASDALDSILCFVKFWLAFSLISLMGVLLAWSIVRAAHGDFWLLAFSLAGFGALFYHGCHAHS